MNHCNLKAVCKLKHVFPSLSDNDSNALVVDLFLKFINQILEEW